MDEERPRRRQTRLSRAARTKRILERLREGWTYDEVAGEVGLKERRVRQIVTEFLKEREAVSGAAHAHMQLDRLGRAMRVAGDALARGDIRAIAPFIRVIDRLDRYQTLVAHTAARPEAVVDGAADQLIVDSIFARVRRTVLKEMRTQAAESDAAAAGPPSEPDGDFGRGRAARRRRDAGGAGAAALRAARPGAAAAERRHGWGRLFSTFGNRGKFPGTHLHKRFCCDCEVKQKQSLAGTPDWFKRVYSGFCPGICPGYYIRP